MLELPLLSHLPGYGRPRFLNVTFLEEKTYPWSSSAVLVIKPRIFIATNTQFVDITLIKWFK